MSFIERALAHLKQDPPAAEREGPVAVQPVPTPSRTVAGSSYATSTMPCRNDRVLAINRDALRRAGVLGPEDEEYRLAEEYRVIKRPLLRSMGAGDAPAMSNILALTSAVPGEGKTFTSINLALSLAMERDREVILVDGDVVKRHITHLFELDDEPGFLDVAGETGHSLEQAILRTDIPSLYILPAGNQHLEATEILASERAARMLAALAADPQRVVLIDTPPLLATSEAGVLASLAGQVVLVVRASETPRDAVASAIESVTEDKPISLVLNQVLSVPDRNYGYYYGEYGYGRHGGDKSREAGGQARMRDGARTKG